MSHIIELKKVSKYYAGNDSVSMGFSRIDLDLDMGEFVAITGESGSGKSTLLNVISGLDSYEEGEMFVGGEDTSAFTMEDYERYRKTYIGNIFQDFNLVNSYTVYQNIELVMLLNGKKKGECKERIDELLSLVGLSEYSKTKASKLSGGQKQRVAIARALAKDAPIIVADEPTGNLDSESAASVMETLSRVSKDKLVVIVTHNYEQAEPYVTRKLRMHDGKIIEDRRIDKSLDNFADIDNSSNVEVDEDQISENKGINMGSQLSLGLRNTFNIPAKFILLFIVYLFVATAVLGQYASTKNSLHQSDLLGYSTYFMDVDSARVIVTKDDLSEFTDEDISKLENIENIENIVVNDLAIDKGASINLDEAYFEGSVYPVSNLQNVKLTYGKMPEKDNEIVIGVNTDSDAYSVVEEKNNELIGKKVYIDALDGSGRLTDKKVKIVGIYVNKADDADANMAYSYYSKIYVTEGLSKTLLTGMMASASTTELNYAGNKVENDYSRVVYSLKSVPKGQVYISDSQQYYYKDGKGVGKKLTVKISNKYYKASKKLTVGKIITEKNIKSVLGMSRDEYDMISTYVYVNPKDFKDMFERNSYQVSAYMKDETLSEETVDNLKSSGFNTLLIKDTLTDITGGFDFVIELITFGLLILEFIVLFFISYSVIRIIMKSRNTYYSTLRILGASKKNTDNILRIELVFMMILAYIVDLVVVALVKVDIIKVKQTSQLLKFLTLSDYIILAILLIVMSLLIANRYSKKIFSKSAMKSFKEEA